MDNEHKKTSVTIEYRENPEAKERFIRFLVDYFLENDIYGKAGVNEKSRANG